MVSALISAAVIAVGLSALIVAGSTAAVAYRIWSYGESSERSAVLLREKLRAYRELLDTIVGFNRTAVEIGEEKFQLEAERMALEQESELDEPYRDVHQAFESNFHIIAPKVRLHASEFLDYPTTYHEEGATLGGLLSQAGEVFTAMRADLSLKSLFDENVPAGEVDAETPPTERDGTADFEDLNEDVEKDSENIASDMPDLEDLDYFNPSTRDED